MSYLVSYENESIPQGWKSVHALGAACCHEHYRHPSCGWPEGHGAAKEFARRAHAHTDCLNLQAALDDYLLDHSSFPSAWFGLLATEGDFLNTLMGEKNEHNRASTTYFNTRQVNNHPKAHGYIVILNQFNDPWGKPYQIRVDQAFEGAVPLPRAYHGHLGSELLGMEVFVHSAGRDGDFSTIKDNITSVD